MNDTLNGQDLIYLQIAQMLEDDIIRGVYGEDRQVPSTNELAQKYEINPATAAKGVNLLTAEGVLYKRRGVGMFVSKGTVEKLKERRRAAFYEDYVRPLVREGSALGLMGRDLLGMLQKAIEEDQRERLAEKQPAQAGQTE